MKGLPRSLSRGSLNRQEIVKARFAASTTLVVNGASGVGFGAIELGSLPQGNIMLLGAVAYITATEASAGITDTWSGDFGLGTTVASDATLTGADIDIIPSTPIGPAVAGASPRTRGASTTQVMLDNTDGSLEINFSLLVDDANISAAGVNVTVEYEVILLYSVLGDD